MMHRGNERLTAFPVRRPVAARRTHRPRIGRRWLVLSSCVVAVVSVAATAGMLRVYSPRAIPSPRADARGRTAGLEVRARIVATDANRSFFASTGGDYDQHVQRWLEALQCSGAEVCVARSLDEWTGAPDELLVLPHAYCLSDDDIAHLEQGMRAGGGVLVAGILGVRDESGRWLGWDRMHRILGSRALREFPRDEAAFMTVAPTGPVGNEGLSGYRIALMKRESQWGIAGLPAAAFWLDYFRHPIPRGEEAWASAAVRSYGSGRLAWVGYDPDLAAGDSENREIALSLTRSLISWCVSVPSAGIDLWPYDRKAAVLIVEDTERDFENARLLDTILSAHDIRGSFMCVTRLARRDPELVRALARRHEVGSHGEEHASFAKQSFRKQLRRLEGSDRDLERLTERPTAGFRPPEEGYDRTTLQALASSGYGYVLGNIDAPNVLPEILRYELRRKKDASLVRVPRVGLDDYELVVKNRMVEDDILATLLDELDMTRRVCGVDFVSLHTHILGTPERVEVVDRFLNEADLEGFWVTGADSLASWWRARDLLSVSLRPEGDGGAALQVMNGGHEEVRSAGVWVMIPGNPDFLVADGGGARVWGPDARGAYRLSIDWLEPGERFETWLRPAHAAVAHSSARIR